MKKITLTAILLIFMCLGKSEAWEFNRTVSVKYVSESNITQEFDEKWRIKDSGIETALKLGAEKEDAPGKRWILSLNLKDHKNKSFSSHDRFYYGVRAAYRRKLGLGHMAPWWMISAGTGEELYKNDDVHNRWLSLVQLEYGKRLDLKNIITGILTLDSTHGDKTEVFNQRGVSAAVRGQYSMDNSWALTWGVMKRKGDVTIHGWEDYYSFSPYVVMHTWPGWKGKMKAMYKVSDADTLKYELGAVFTPDKRSSWRFGYENYKTVKNSLSYPNSIYSVQYSINF